MDLGDDFSVINNCRYAGFPPLRGNTCQNNGTTLFVNLAQELVHAAAHLDINAGCRLI